MGGVRRDADGGADWRELADAKLIYDELKKLHTGLSLSQPHGTAWPVAGSIAYAAEGCTSETGADGGGEYGSRTLGDGRAGNVVPGVRRPQDRLEGASVCSLRMVLHQQR